MSKIGNTYVEVLADMTQFTAEVRAKTSKKTMPDAEVKVDVDSAGAEKSLSTLSKRLITANQSLGLLDKGTKLIKWPAMIAGASAAAQAVNSLAAGTAALAGSLTPLAGLLAAAPALYGAMGQAAGVVALSGVKDLTDALGGNEEALKRLTPQGKKFFKTLKELQPQIDKLKSAVQKPLFQGMEAGVSSAIKNLPAFKGVMVETSKVMGGLAADAGKLLGSKGFGKDFAEIGKNNAKLLGRMGKAGLGLGSALRHVMVAAGPLVDWLGKGADSFGEWANQSAKAGRESGALAKFFGETKNTLKIVGPLLGNLGKGLWNVIRAGKPLGDDILRSLADSAKEFRMWTESARGENALAQWFKDAKAPLWETGRLIKDIGAAFFDVGKGEGLAGLIRTFRLEMLPVIVDVLKASKGFGPVFMEFAKEGLKAMKPLLGANGTLTVFLMAVTNILKAFNKLVEIAPIVGTALTTALTVKGISSLAGVGGGLLSLAGGGGKKGTGSGVTAAGAGAGGGLLSNLFTKGGAAAGGAAVGSSFTSRFSGALKNVRWARVGGVGIGLALADGVQKGFASKSQAKSGDILTMLQGRKTGGIGGAASDALNLPKKLGVPVVGDAFGDGGAFDMRSDQQKSASKMLDLVKQIGESSKPVTMEQARQVAEWRKTADLSSEQRKNVGNLVQQLEAAARSKVSWTPGFSGKSANQFKTDLQNLKSGVFTTMKQIQGVANRAMSNVQGTPSQILRGQSDIMRAQARAMMKAGIGETKQGLEQIRTLLRNADLTQGLQPARFGLKFAEGFRNAKQITARGIQDVIGQLQLMPPKAQQIAGQTMLRQALQYRQKGKLSVDEWRKIRGQILSQIEGLKDPAQSKASKAAKAAAQGFSKVAPGIRSVLSGIQDMVSNALSSLGQGGISFNLGGALSGLLGAFGAGSGEGKQLGGIVKAQMGAALVPGAGNGDTVPLHIAGRLAAMVEPKEIVSVTNRNAAAALMNVNKAVPRFAEGGGIKVSGKGGQQKLGQGSANKGEEAANKYMKKFLPALQILKAAKNIGGPYVYGGGHGSFTGQNVDCSGLVSYLLNAGGLLSGSPITTDGLKTWGVEGDGVVTVGVRGSTGRSAHTMIKVGSKYFESGSGHGAQEVSGWAGTFPIHRKPAGMQRGGLIDIPGKRLLKRNRKGLESLDPGNPGFVGWGLQGGGIVPSSPAKGSKWINAGAGWDPDESFTGMRQLGIVRAVAKALSTKIMGESGGKEGVVSSDGGYGLLQMTTGQGNDDIINKWGGAQAMLRWKNNFLAANELFARGGIGGWFAPSGPAGKFLSDRVGGKSGAGIGAGKTKKLKKGNKLGVPAKLQSLINTLTGNADLWSEYADRASQIEGPVLGKNEIDWLKNELQALFDLRNALVTAHEYLAKLRNSLTAQISRTKGGKAKKSLKTDLGTVNTNLGTVLDSLGEVQGSSGPLSHLASLPPIGEIGGRIFEVQMALKDAGAQSGATEKGITSSQLKEIGYLRDLGVKFNADQFAGFFARGGILGAGQWGIAGENGPETIVGPAQVIPSGTPIVSPSKEGVVVYVMVEDGAVDPNKIRAVAEGAAEVKIEQHNRDARAYYRTGSRA